MRGREIEIDREKKRGRDRVIESMREREREGKKRRDRKWETYRERKKKTIEYSMCNVRVWKNKFMNENMSGKWSN